jgi:hypothetical protein
MISRANRKNEIIAKHPDWFLTLTTLPPSKTRRYGSIRKLEDKLYALAMEYREFLVKILKRYHLNKTG